MDPDSVVIIEALKATDVDLAREACPVALALFPPTVWHSLAGTDATGRARVASIAIFMLRAI